METTKFASVLNRVSEFGRAVGAFTCYNFEQLEAVVRAAEARQAPVIVLISPSSFQSAGGERLVRSFRAATARASVDVLLQLDHIGDVRTVEHAAGCGVDAVMADGSKLSFRDNLAFTRAVVRSMQPRGIGVEAELGRMEGQEDRVGEALVAEMTDPYEAEEFLERSGADCLAVAVGNVHGHYSGLLRSIGSGSEKSGAWCLLHYPFMGLQGFRMTTCVGLSQPESPRLTSTPS